jgi:carbon storage regulator CsrA
MLVLSRRQQESIVFANLNIRVEVLKLAGNSVRLGIEAPAHVQVLREEISQRAAAITAAHPSLQHELRNRFHSATLALHLLERQLKADRTAEAEVTLQSALAELAKLEALLDGKSLDGAQAIAEPSRELHRHPQGPRPRRRALLVEDDANERELLAGFLRLSGFDVEVAEDGVCALEMLKRAVRPDLVILDMHMPRMDGRATLFAIRDNPALAGLKIFAVSGAARESWCPESNAQRVDRWFSKPLNPLDFVDQLDVEFSSAPA